MVSRTRWATAIKKIRFWLLAALCMSLSLLLHSPAVQSHESQFIKINTFIAQASRDEPQITASHRLLTEGRDRYTQGNLEAAIALWHDALQAYESQGDAVYQSVVLTYLSLAYQDLGDWEQAQRAIASSIQIIEEQLTDNAQQTSLLAQALTAKGRLELSMGQTETALTTWQTATALYQDLSDETGTTGSLVNQSLALERLGFYRRSCSTVLKAVGVEASCQTAALQDIEHLLDQLEASSQQNLSVRVLGLRNLGNVLRLMGYLSRSHQVLERTLDMSSHADLVLATTDTQLSLGNTEYALYQQAQELYERTKLEGDRAQVIAAAEQALTRYQDIIDAINQPPATHFLSIQAQLHRLRLLLDFQRWTQTNDADVDSDALQREIQAQIQRLFHENVANLPPSQTTIYMQLDFAESLVKANIDWLSTSIQMTQTAAHEAERLSDQRSHAYALGILGNLYEQWGSLQPEQLVMARQFSEEALGIAQAIQAWDIAYRWQWQLGRIYKKAGDRETAISYYQTSVNTLRDVRKNLVATETDLQFSFRDTVEPVYREWVSLLLEETTDSALTQVNLQQAVQAIDALQLSELENFLRCDLTPSVAIDETQIDPEAAVLYTMILENQLAVVLQLPNSEQLHLHTVALPQADVHRKLIALKSELTRPYISPRGLALEQEVYDWLIRPIEPDLVTNDVKTLVFVLDGELRSVPMAALHNGETYLIEQYAIALSPGLQLLQPYPLKRLSLSSLTFGLSETRQNFSPHSGFPPLENVEVEVQTIENAIAGHTLLNEDFTSTAMHDWIRSSPDPIVHLATHGQFSSSPDETFVLAWDERVSIGELGSILQSRSLSNANPIELLVLSACKTADGDSRATLGLAGVAVQSGARSTIASLWSINDDSTARLMGLFYQELIDSNAPVGKAETLRRAQVRLLHTPGYHAPLFWAPYVLIGNWL